MEYVKKSAINKNIKCEKCNSISSMYAGYRSYHKVWFCIKKECNWCRNVKLNENGEHWSCYQNILKYDTRIDYMIDE